jgi:TonB family protein
MKGALVVEYVVEIDGHVGPIRVIRSAHPVVDAAWVEAIKKWRYRPATLNGKPIRFAMTSVINTHAERSWPRIPPKAGAA